MRLQDLSFDPSQVSASFVEKVAKEFKESALDARWLDSGIVTLIPSQTIEHGEVTGYPVLDMLGWDTPRTQAFSLVKLGDAMAFADIWGCVWKIKPQHPRTSKDKNGKEKIHKYEHLKGEGSPGYFICDVPDFAREEISQRFSVTVPTVSEVPNFWEWWNTSNLPLLITEGEKKTLAGLQSGYPTIGALGINGGYRVNSDYTRRLADGISSFELSRPITIAFDRDSNQETIEKTEAASGVLGRLLEDAGASVYAMKWDADLGKGMDDFIASQGVEAFHKLYDDRKALKNSVSSLKADEKLDMPDLSNADVNALCSYKLLVLKSHKGTGKTKFMAKFLERAREVYGKLKTLNPVHRVTLGTQISARLGTIMRNDHNSQILPDEISFCLESIEKIDMEKFGGDYIVVIDELRQVVMHLLMSDTLKGHRAYTISKFRQMIEGARQIIVADADMSPDEVRILEILTGIKAHVVENTYRHDGFDVYWYQGQNDSAILQSLWEHLENRIGQDGKPTDGKTTIVCSDSRKQTEIINKKLCDLYPDLRVLLINQDSTGEDHVKQFVRCPDADIANWDVVIYSPTLGTGVSIEIKDQVDSVWGFFMGGSLNTASMSQALSRVRDLVPRHVWVNEARNQWNYSKSGSPKKIRQTLEDRSNATIHAIAQDLHDSFSRESWYDSAFVELFCRYVASDNRDGYDLRGGLRARLEDENNRIIDQGAEVCPQAKEEKKEIREAIKEQRREELKDIALIPDELAKQWKQSQALTKEQKRKLEKWRICDTYCVDDVDDALLDFDGDDGEGRRQVREFRKFMDAEFSQSTSLRSITRLTEIKKPSDFTDDCGWEAKDKCPQDIDTAMARHKILQALDLQFFLDADRLYTPKEMQDAAWKILTYSDAIRKIFGNNLSKKMKPAQVVKTMLEKMGIKLKAERKATGYHYRLDSERFEFLVGVLERQQERQAKKEAERAEREGQNLPSDRILIVKTGGSVDFAPKTAVEVIPVFTADDVQDGVSLVEEGLDLDDLWEMWQEKPGYFEAVIAEMSQESPKVSQACCSIDTSRDRA